MTNQMKQGYDIIGDIHGHCDALEELLHRMGYQHNGTSYQHPTRKVIFVGDLIDRGPKIRETLQIAKAMFDNGQALVILGNHEYNAVCYCSDDDEGKPLREHSEKNVAQFKATDQAFAEFPEERNAYLDWFKQLPLYLDMGDFRVAHACWSQRHIDVLEGKTLGDRNFLLSSSIKQTPEYWAIETVLKGAEFTLPDGISYADKEGTVRTKTRAKWWISMEGTTYRSGSFPEQPKLPDDPVAASAIDDYWDIYPATEPPMFCGHYWLPPETPEPHGNIICLDYSVAKGGFLTSYRWGHGEQIASRNFVTTVD